MSSETNEPIGAARNPAPAIAFENVTCSFETPEGVYTATKDVSFSIGDGEFVSVVGPTGCGKSTLLNAAAGLLKPAAGRVLIYGEALNGINHRAGYMFQAESLMPWATAIDNVMMSLKFRGVPEMRRVRRALTGSNAWGSSVLPTAIRMNFRAACVSALPWPRP